MSKKRRDVRAEHEAAVREFEARPEPVAWICFFWPHLNRWQAIAAYDGHLALIPAARQLALEGRRLFQGDSPSDVVLAGDCANTLANLVLEQHDHPNMGGLLAFVSQVLELKFIFAVSRRVFRNNEDGSAIDLQEMPGVTTVKEARAWVDSHPGIILAKAQLLADLRKGPQH
jgi:hypothetical protein